MQWSLIGAVFRAAISLLSNIAIVRIIEIEKISTYYSTVAAFGIVLGILELGIPQILIYTNDKEYKNMSASAIGYGLIMFAVFQIMSIALVALKFFNTSGNENYILFALALSSVAFSLPANALRAVLEKKLLVIKLAQIDFFALITLMAFLPVVLIAPDEMSHLSYSLLALIIIGPQIIIISLLGINVSRTGQKLELNFEALRCIGRRGKYFSANHLIFSGYQQVDLFIAQKFLSTQEAGFYAVARVLVIQMGNVIYTGVAKFTNSKIAFQQKTSGINLSQRLNYLKMYACISVCFLFGAVIFGNYYIEIAYGKEWIPSISSMEVLLVGMAMRVFSVPSAAQIVASSGVKTILASNTAGVILTLILGTAGVYLAGRNGLAIAVSTVIAIITVSYIVKAK